MSTPAAFSIGSQIDCQPALPSTMVLPSSALRLSGFSPLRNAKSNTSAPPIWKTETSGMPCARASENTPGDGIADIGLVLVDELHGCRRIGRSRLERRFDVAEIAELLADPIGIVVEHFDRAARAHPADRVGGMGLAKPGKTSQRSCRDAGRGQGQQAAASNHRIPIMLFLLFLVVCFSSRSIFLICM